MSNGLRLIVCGGRSYDNFDLLCSVLDSIHARRGITMVIEGGAKGADAHAATWADNKGIPRVTCHANWRHHNSGAGPKRNKVMLMLNPNGVVAFPGGTGTANMTRQAEEAGIKVMSVSAINWTETTKED